MLEHSSLQPSCNTSYFCSIVFITVWYVKSKHHETVFLKGQTMFQEGQTMFLEGSMMVPGGQTMFIEGQTMFQESQGMVPEGQTMLQDRQIMFLEGHTMSQEVKHTLFIPRASKICNFHLY